MTPTENVFGGLIFIIVGSAYLALGVYRIRKPNWFVHSWWSRHRIIATLIHPDRPWFELTRKPYEDKITTRRLGTTMAVGFGVLLLGVGLVAFTSGIRAL